MPGFTSGLFRPGSSQARADTAAFDNAVATLPAASRRRVQRMARGEAAAVQARRRGDRARRGGIPWAGSTAEEQAAFGRYLHARPQSW